MTDFRIRLWLGWQVVKTWWMLWLVAAALAWATAYEVAVGHWPSWVGGHP